MKTKIHTLVYIALAISVFINFQKREIEDEESHDHLQTIFAFQKGQYYLEMSDASHENQITALMNEQHQILSRRFQSATLNIQSNYENNRLTFHSVVDDNLGESINYHYYDNGELFARSSINAKGEGEGLVLSPGGGVLAMYNISNNIISGITLRMNLNGDVVRKYYKDGAVVKREVIDLSYSHSLDFDKKTMPLDKMSVENKIPKSSHLGGLVLKSYQFRKAHIHKH